MISARRADLIMLFITLIWGGTFPLIKNSLAYTNANWFVVLRFILASMVLLPFVIPRLSKTSRTVFFAGMVLGLLNGFGFYAQTIGLKTIGSAESAFISATTVIIIPLLLPFFKLGRPHWLEIIDVVVCLLGIYILTGANIHRIGAAEIWTFVCAGTTAMAVVFLQKISKKIQDFALLAFYQALFAIIIPLISSIVQQQYHAVFSSLTLWTGLLYCSVLATALVFFVQSRYQQYTSPTKVGIIFTMEPVFASLFAFLFNHEIIILRTLVGGLIILGSLILTEVKNFKIFKK